ncbi:MAG: hypothetical protein AAB593_01380 [Patescibacteria group bacterium]
MNNILFKKIASVFLMGALVFFVYSTVKAEEINKENNNALERNEEVDKGGFWGWNVKLNKFFSDNWNFFTTGDKEEQSPIDVLIEPNKQKESGLLELRHKYEKQEENSAIEIIKELIFNVENYYKNGFIKKDWVAESLINDLNKSILGLEKINSLNDNIWFSRKNDAQEKIVILNLKKIVFKVRFYGNHIDDDISNYIIKIVEEIERNI